MTLTQNAQAEQPSLILRTKGLHTKGLRTTTKWAALIVVAMTSALASSAQAAAQDSIKDVVPDGTSSDARKINNNGQVAGNFLSDKYRAFFYNGVPNDLDTALGNPAGGSYASDLNDSGLTVGSFDDSSATSHAFLYSPATGTAQDLSSAFPSGTTQSDANSINSSGIVVGEFYNGRIRAFRYSGGVAQDLSSTFPIGTIYSNAYSINNSGSVVGYFNSTNFSDSHAFVYSGGVGRDLNDLIPAGSGWVLTSASGINNSGQITGNGIFGGQYRAFVLSLRTWSGQGMFGVGRKRAFVNVNTTMTANAPGAVGTFTFSPRGGAYLINAPVRSMSFGTNSVTISGPHSRGKGFAPGFYVATFTAGNTFTIAFYGATSATPFYQILGSAEQRQFLAVVTRPIASRKSKASVNTSTDAFAVNRVLDGDSQ